MEYIIADLKSLLLDKEYELEECIKEFNVFDHYKNIEVLAEREKLLTEFIEELESIVTANT